MNESNVNETGTESTLSKAFKTSAYWAILLASLLGNTLLILAIKRNINGRMRTVSNLLIASLAVSDLMLTVWSFPERMTRTATNDAWLIPGDGGSILCKIVNFTEKLSITVSVLHLAALALERFLVVFYPYRTIIKTHFVKYITGSIWTLSVLYWSPILYYGKIIGDTELRCEVRRFTPHWRHWYLAFIVILCIVMLAILLLYTTLAINLCRRKTPTFKLATQRNKSEHIKRSVVIMVGIIIVTFYVCFLPYWIGWVWCSYARTMPKQICNQTYKFISIFLSNMSCMANPIICFTFIGYFRFAFRAILHDPFNRKERELRVKVRRKSSLTELDSVLPQSKNGAKNGKNLLQEKENSNDALNNGSLPLISSQPTTTEQNNSIESISMAPLERKNDNTASEIEANLQQSAQGDVNEDGESDHKDQISCNLEDNPANKDVFTIYGTPL